MPVELSDSKVLIVDDLNANIVLLKGALGKDYELSFASNGEQALELAAQLPPDLILLDIMMPGMDGYEVCTRLKSNPITSEVPVIFITALSELSNKTKGFQAGAVDFITKPMEVREVRERVRIHLTLRQAQLLLKQQNERLDLRVKERTRELVLMRDALIESLGSLTEYRDPETGNHIQRTSMYLGLLSRELSSHPKFKDYLSGDTPELLAHIAPLHDIGKVGVPDYILLKPGKLSKEEAELMKMHTVYGYKTLLNAEKKMGKNRFIRMAMELAHSHHEAFDGSGYPLGLKGEEIPLPGRLMSIVDVYDALISPRVYKLPIPHEQAVDIILKGDGRTSPAHFDPVILEAFMSLHNDFHAISQEFCDSDEDADTYD